MTDFNPEQMRERAGALLRKCDGNPQPCDHDDCEMARALLDRGEALAVAQRHLDTLDSPHMRGVLESIIGAENAKKALRVIRLAMEMADAGHEAGEASLASLSNSATAEGDVR